MQKNQKTGRRRSLKSLSEDTWAEVFRLLPKDMRIAIVIGKSHPDYCHTVCEKAATAGISPEVVEGSLSDVAKAIIQSKRFVGMDSGTTHLARQAILSAAVAGRSITFRQLFNTNLAEVLFHEYGFAHPDMIFPALVPTNISSENVSTDDLNLSPEAVSRFILADDSALI